MDQIKQNGVVFVHSWLNGEDSKASAQQKNKCRCN